MVKDTNEKDRRRAARLSFVAGVIILGFKFWAYHVTGSQAAYSDALESIINVITAATVLFVIWYSAKPADKDHPYGHGKIEFFSAAFEGGLIAFAAVLIVAKAISVLWEGPQLKELDLGLMLLGIAGVGNLGLGIILLKIGDKVKSDALKASGHHVLSDFTTSAAVILGLFGVKLTGWMWLDPVMAILVGLHLGFTGLKIVLRSAGALMDAEDVHLLGEILELFKTNWFPGIIRIHHTRVIRSGDYHHIDAHVVVPEFWDVSQTHDKTSEFESRVINSYQYSGEIHFHVDPCRRAYCRVCDLTDCPIRTEQFQERIPISIEELRNPMEAEEFLGSR